MTIEITARAASQYFPAFEEAVLMTAICGGESTFNPEAGGDPPIGLLKRYSGFACNGKLSWGLGQIFLGVWAPTVANMSGIDISRPCDLARWLSDPMNNLRMCRHVFEAQGWTAWSAFKAGTYQPYMESARVAVEEALQGTRARETKLSRLALSNGNLHIETSTGETHDFPIEDGDSFHVTLDMQTRLPF